MTQEQYDKIIGRLDTILEEMNRAYDYQAAHFDGLEHQIKELVSLMSPTVPAPSTPPPVSRAQRCYEHMTKEFCGVPEWPRLRPEQRQVWQDAFPDECPKCQGRKVIVNFHQGGCDATQPCPECQPPATEAQKLICDHCGCACSNTTAYLFDGKIYCVVCYHHAKDKADRK